jgi:hypothetical protein
MSPMQVSQARQRCLAPFMAASSPDSRGSSSENGVVLKVKLFFMMAAYASLSNDLEEPSSRTPRM